MYRNGFNSNFMSLHVPFFFLNGLVALGRPFPPGRARLLPGRFLRIVWCRFLRALNRVFTRWAPGSRHPSNF